MAVAQARGIVPKPLSVLYPAAMRVLSQTHLRLEASVHSRLNGVICTALGGLFAAIGLTALASGEPQGLAIGVPGLGILALGVWLLSRRTRVVIDRSENLITVETRHLFGHAQQMFALDKVVRARVLRRRDNGRKRYQLVLEMRGEPENTMHSISGGFSGGGWRKGRLSRALNAWLGAKDA